MRQAVNSDVQRIDVEIDRPVDRSAKEGTVRGNDDGTISATGSGGSSTLVENNSESSWYLEHATCQALGAGAGIVQVTVQVRDASDNVITSGICDATGNGHIPFAGQIVKPGWDVHATVSQSDSESYDVTVIPVIRKPSPTSPKHIEPVQVIDDFESQSLSAYTATSGAKSDWSFNTNDTYHGNVSIETSTGGAGLQSTSGLTNMFEHGDRAVCYVKSAGGQEASAFVHFAVADSNNFHRAELQFDNDRLYLETMEGGSVTTLDNVFNVNLDADTWYAVQMSRADGNQVNVAVVDTVTETEVGAVGQVNTFHKDANGVGFSCENTPSSTMRFDFYHKPRV